MNLWGPLARLQTKGAEFYLKLADRFSGSEVVRDTWTAMARDLADQAASLKALRPSFWKLLQKEEKTLLEAIHQIAPPAPSGSFDPAAWTLHTSFERTLDFEEQLSLKVYSPIIYHLRIETVRTLDFYVIVHAHLTRMARLIEPFSGDPFLIQRCLALVERFEKEAQGPEPEPLVVAKKRAKVAARRARPAHGRVPARLVARSARPKKMIARRAHKPAKPLVKNIKLARRRVRR